MRLYSVALGLLWSCITVPCLASPAGNITAAPETYGSATGHPPECLALKTPADEDPRWNTQSPDINEPLCKGTWWRGWPAINWEITIPNDHIFDADAIANNPQKCGISVYNQISWKALPSWISCDMHGTTAYLKFRVFSTTEVSTIAEAFNAGTCHTFQYVNCYKKRGGW